MTDWNRVAEKCEDEISKAHSSRLHRGTMKKYPNANVARLNEEEDEFLAKELAFREIGRSCRAMVPEAVEDRIKSMRYDPPPETDLNDQAAYKGRHWPKAYEYALQQCDLAHLL